MGYGIQDFYRTAQNYGLARTNVFRVKQITNDVFLSDTDQDLYVYSKTGAIPSRNIGVGKVSYKSFDFNVPLQAIYQDSQNWQVTFYSDQAYTIRSAFEKWSKSTFNEHGHFTSTNFGSCDVELVLLDLDSSIDGDINSQERETVTYTLKGCFPVSVGAISYNSTNAGEVVEISATLAYQYVESLNKNI